MRKPTYHALKFALALFWLLLAACTQAAPTTTPPATVALPTPITTVETATPSPPPSPTACEPFTTRVATLPSHVPTYSYKIINSYPHDPTAFTQGLLYDDGILYESTGIKVTGSSLRQVELETGEILQRVDLAEAFFGEGLVLWQDQLIQLTWTSQIAFIYDKENFNQIGTFEYSTQGWGITHDGRCLIMSDGSNNLYFRDPETFAEMGRIAVVDTNGAVTQLNELEFVEGEIWANVWQTNRIVRIDPATGQVVGEIDLTGLLDVTDLEQRVDVLNGIAYDQVNGRLFVTGKLWPTLFEIELVPLAD